MVSVKWHISPLQWTTFEYWEQYLSANWTSFLSIHLAEIYRPWLLFLKSNKIGLANNQLLEKLYAKDSNLSQNVYKKKTVKFVLLEPLNNAKNGGIRLAEWRCAPLPHIPTSFRSRTLSSIVTSRRCRIIHRFYSKFTICHYSFCMK